MRKYKIKPTTIGILPKNHARLKAICGNKYYMGPILDHVLEVMFKIWEDDLEKMEDWIMESKEM